VVEPARDISHRRVPRRDSPGFAACGSDSSTDADSTPGQDEAADLPGLIDAQIGDDSIEVLGSYDVDGAMQDVVGPDGEPTGERYLALDTTGSSVEIERTIVHETGRHRVRSQRSRGWRGHR
jgi:hypothetical protein